MAQCYRNLESLVTLVGTQQAFRNPPVFLMNTTQTGAAAAAEAEVEALLDHLFTHANTPVCIAKRLIIQRLVTFDR